MREGARLLEESKVLEAAAKEGDKGAPEGGKLKQTLRFVRL